MQTNLTIREAVVADAPGIAHVHIATWKFAYRGQLSDEYLNSLSEETRTKRWEESLSNEASSVKVFVAESRGEIIGFCSVGPSRDNDSDKSIGELYAIYVLPESMSRGVGSALMQAGLAALKKHGYQKATLWVLTSNEKTRKFYEHKGWRAADGKTKVDKNEHREIHETRYAFEL